METFLSLDALTSALSTTAILLVWLTAGLLLYGYLFDRAVFEGHGRVQVERFSWPEATIGAALIAMFVLLIAAPDKSDPAKPPTDAMMVASAVLSAVILAGIMGGILAVLAVRKISWRDTFGLTRLHPAGIVGRAVVLLVLALPLIGGALMFTQWVLGVSEGDDPQETVRFFSESGSVSAKWAVAVSALVFAPIQEEFIFRGFLYGVLRRYLGRTLGIVLNAALFAGIHRHPPVLGGLFVLAVCLTLAYEWTGCIFVPMAMHALFNSLTVISLLSGGKG